MARYLSLITFTEEGIRNIQLSIERAEAFRATVEAAGGKVLQQYWATGEVDGCVIFEVPSEQIGASLILKLGKEGHVRTRSLQLYNADEFKDLLEA